MTMTTPMNTAIHSYVRAQLSPDRIWIAWAQANRAMASMTMNTNGVGQSVNIANGVSTAATAKTTSPNAPRTTRTRTSSGHEGQCRNRTSVDRRPREGQGDGRPACPLRDQVGVVAIERVATLAGRDDDPGRVEIGHVDGEPVRR